MNVLASPAFFHDDLKELEGKYYAFDIALATYDVADDRFEGVGVLGEEIRRGRFVRCKS